MRALATECKPSEGRDSVLRFFLTDLLYSRQGFCVESPSSIWRIELFGERAVLEPLTSVLKSLLVPLTGISLFLQRTQCCLRLEPKVKNHI